MIYILYVFIYVFFIYGVIEFIRNIYIGFNIPENTHPIKIVVNDEKSLEYTMLSIKDRFSPITICIEEDNTKIMDMIDILKDDYEIKIEYLK